MGVDAESSEFDALPFAARCRALDISAPLRWLRLGAGDFRRAWPQSLTYGVLMAGAMAGVTGLAWQYGQYWFMLAMLGGFVPT